MADITLKLTLAQVKHLQEQYASIAVVVTHPYALFLAKVDDVEIHLSIVSTIITNLFSCLYLKKSLKHIVIPPLTGLSQTNKHLALI